MRIPFDQSAAIGRTFIDLTPEITAAILLTIEAGWEIARQRAEVHPSAKEVEITECLRDAMRAALATKRYPWGKTMVVLPGTESRSQAGMTTPDGRTDIPLFLTKIFSRSGEHDPHAIIECKRVAAGDSTLAREYVVEGVDRFCTGKYAGNHGKGFMAGYVLSGEPAAAVQGINGYFDDHGRHAEQLNPSALAGSSCVWTSRHLRAAPATPVELHHSMLLVVGA